MNRSCVFRFSIRLVLAGVVTLLSINIRVVSAQSHKPVPQAGAPAGNVENGRKAFIQHGCFSCHGFSGEGGPGARLAQAPFRCRLLCSMSGDPNVPCLRMELRCRTKSWLTCMPLSNRSQSVFVLHGDERRLLEIYPLEGDTFSSGFMMVYVPKEKILVEANDFSWRTGTRAGLRYLANNVNLYLNIQHLKLDVKTIAPIHGKPVSLSELQKATPGVSGTALRSWNRTVAQLTRGYPGNFGPRT